MLFLISLIAILDIIASYAHTVCSDCRRWVLWFVFVALRATFKRCQVHNLAGQHSSILNHNINTFQPQHQYLKNETIPNTQASPQKPPHFRIALQRPEVPPARSKSGEGSDGERITCKRLWQFPRRQLNARRSRTTLHHIKMVQLNA